MGACPLTGPVWGDGNILLGGLAATCSRAAAATTSSTATAT